MKQRKQNSSKSTAISASLVGGNEAIMAPEPGKLEIDWNGMTHRWGIVSLALLWCLGTVGRVLHSLCQRDVVLVAEVDNRRLTSRLGGGKDQVRCSWELHELRDDVLHLSGVHG